jgi:hypothetical protein
VIRPAMNNLWSLGAMLKNLLAYVPNMGGTRTASIIFGIYHLNSLLAFIALAWVRH